MDEAMKVFAQNVQKYRTEKGLSQDELATMSGLHRTYISSVERGDRNISIGNVSRIAEALGIEPYHLFLKNTSSSISVIHQPLNGQFGTILNNVLTSSDYKKFDFVTAYAKMSGVMRMKEAMLHFKKNGGYIRAFVGIDQHNTTYEALCELFEVADELFIIHNEDYSRTFHHKIYMLSDNTNLTNRVWLTIGSNNLTAGGMFLNYESCTISELDMQDKSHSEIYRTTLGMLQEYSSDEYPLSLKIMSISQLDSMHDKGYILKEKESNAATHLSLSNQNRTTSGSLFGRERIKLPRTKEHIKTETGHTSHDEIVAEYVPNPTIDSLFWFEMRKSTGGSRNILDLSSSGKLRGGNASKTFYNIVGTDKTKGSVTFFDVDPEQHDYEKNITISYQGNSYYPSTIKYAPNNGSWRIQLKGESSTDSAALSEYGTNDFVDNILIFKKIHTAYYILEVVSPDELGYLKNSSLFYATNGINVNSKSYGMLK